MNQKQIRFLHTRNRNPAPVNPMQSSPSPTPQENPNGFQNFMQNTNFLQHVYKHRMVPLWAKPDLAQALLIQHGPGGHIVAHPDISLEDLSK